MCLPFEVTQSHFERIEVMNVSGKIISSVDEMTELFYSQIVLSRLQGAELSEKEKIGLTKLNDVTLNRFEQVKDTVVQASQELTRLELRNVTAQLDPTG